MSDEDNFFICSDEDIPLIDEDDDFIFGESKKRKDDDIIKIEQELSMSKFLPNVDELNELNYLSPMQLKALKYVTETSKKFSERVELKLNRRINKMRGDFEQVLLYIRDRAPIIIHVNLDGITRFLCKDTHYRNCFEVGRMNSGVGINCSSRVRWENRMFNNIYNNSSPYERVKYGVLNALNDPYGVKACSGYGDSYLELKLVRLRTSFAPHDTANNCKIASCEYYCHVLNKYSDAELQALIAVAMNRKSYINSSIIKVYKEIQIHGPIQLNRHVQRLMVNPKYRKQSYIIKQLKEIGEKHQFDIQFMDNFEFIYQTSS